MTTREWLNRGWTLSRQLEVKKAYRDSLANIISRYEPVEVKADHRNTAEDTAIRWSEAQREIEKIETELRMVDTETDKVISKLGNPNEYAVLFCRYIRRLTWGEVAEVTKYSMQHVFKLHSDGVKACGRYMDSIKTFWG